MTFTDLSSEFTETFRAYSYDKDPFGRLQPATLFRFAQQVAIDQCTALGIDAAFYQKTHTGFLLARQTLVLEKDLSADADYRCTTRPSSMQRASYRRVTEVKTPAGEQVACLDSTWVLVDTETRHILRREPPEYAIARWPQEVAVTPLDMSLHRSPASELLGEMQARYTYCDENGHLNNTRYADLFLDALPAEALRSRGVRAMTLYYHREIPLGESFAVCRGEAGENTWYFCCEREGLCCAEGNVRLE